MITQMDENSTLLCQKSINNAFRVADNECARKCLEIEAKGDVTLDKLMPVISGARQVTAYENGDTDYCMFPMGMSAGLVDDIPTVQQLFDNMKAEYADAILNLGR